MKNTALLVIDVQKGLDHPSLGTRNNPQAESNIALLLAEWRKTGRPVIHVKHNSVEPQSKLRPELPGNEVKDEAKPLPAEKQYEKTVNSAFIGTDLEQYLHAQGIADLVVVGLTTDHCISTSVRMADNLGFKVTLISDATAAFETKGHDGALFSADEIHNISLATLNNEFCVIKSTQQLLNKVES
ncbi:MAG: nicotinamidase-related amidase [Cellvibrionaceae bacterium]|jgi:nicotinamidase-related amidase